MFEKIERLWTGEHSAPPEVIDEMGLAAAKEKLQDDQNLSSGTSDSGSDRVH
jgi:hypothetical protein